MEQKQKTPARSDERMRNLISLVMAISAVLIYALTVYGYAQTGRIDWLNVAVAALSLMLAAKIRRDVKRRRNQTELKNN